jgi:hypothetical protein
MKLQKALSLIVPAFLVLGAAILFFATFLGAAFFFLIIINK